MGGEEMSSLIFDSNRTGFRGKILCYIRKIEFRGEILEGIWRIITLVCDMSWSNQTDLGELF